MRFSALILFAFIVTSSGAAIAQKKKAEQGKISQPQSAHGDEIDESGAPLGKKDAPPPAPATAPTRQLLAKIEERHGRSKTVEGTFEQTKVSEIFLETIESKGKFSYLKPDFFRCDYESSEPTTNLIVKDAIYVHVPSLKQVERYQFHTPEERDQQLHVMVLGFGFKAEQVLKEYEVRSSEDDPGLIGEMKKDKLDPAQVAVLAAVPAPALAETSPFTNIKLWIDKKTLLPQKIALEDYNGDKTTIKVIQVRFDVEFAPSLFAAKFPPGTEMIDKSNQ